MYRFSRCSALLSVMVLSGCQHLSLSELAAPYINMMALGQARSARVSSWDTTGGNLDWRPVAPGETLELASLDGAGIIRHVYFTVIGHRVDKVDYLRDLVLRAYWDDETSPSVEAPFGDYFGLGHGKIVFFQSSMITVNPGAKLETPDTTLSVGFNSYFPMPFSNGARLTLTNEGPLPVGSVWYHIDYETVPSIPKDVGRFHAQYRQERPTAATGPEQHRNLTLGEGTNIGGADNYVILDAAGQGNVAGYFLNVDNGFHTWYGEGDDMIFIDGETWPPSFHGTGTEEIFGGGACPNIPYSGPYTGFHLIENEDFFGAVSMYRFYVADPIHFQNSIRMTLEHGHANNFASAYSSTVFWYQTEPHAPFPTLPPFNVRSPRSLALVERTAPDGGILILPTDDRTSRTAGWNHFRSADAYAYEGYWAKAGDGTERFTWRLGELPIGNYEVFVWVPGDPNRDHAADATYTITHAKGIDRLHVDQAHDLERWKSLGLYELDKQSTLMLNNASGDNLVADAVVLVLQE